jgi:cytoplasmic iron level regulating protein YaaA (DUF328/UPF0246 family)
LIKILLAPSETKQSGGTASFAPNTLLFESLLPYRNQLLHAYANCIQRGDLSALSKLFGITKEADILAYKTDIIHELTMKAIERYTGVAFDYLDYPHLDTKARQYIDEHVILFSNLFGPIRASDMIPEYKLKQGVSIGELKPEKIYSEHASNLLDDYLNDDEVLDLRSGFYDKFYKPNKPYTTLKFIKDGKVVSHWAKAYRGLVLREISLHQITTMESFIKHPITGLSLISMQTHKNKTEIIYHIDTHSN